MISNLAYLVPCNRLPTKHLVALDPAVVARTEDGDHLPVVMERHPAVVRWDLQTTKTFLFVKKHPYQTPAERGIGGQAYASGPLKERNHKYAKTRKKCNLAHFFP